MDKITCAFPDCDRPHRARGWCNTHYAQWLTTGRTFPIRTVRPRNVDPIDWFWMGFARSENGCLEWQRGTRHFGYGDCDRSLGDGSMRAHRVAWILTHGPIPDGLWVLHRCDNPACGDVDHLFLGNNADNAADMAAKGRAARQVGEDHPGSKLTGPQVLGILLRLSGGESRGSISRRYGVAYTTVRDIDKGRTWPSYTKDVCLSSA